MPSNLKAFGLHMVGLGSAFGASCDSCGCHTLGFTSNESTGTGKFLTNDQNELMVFLLQDGLKSV